MVSGNRCPCRMETVNRGFEVYFAERAGISGFCRPVEMEGV